MAQPAVFVAYELAHVDEPDLPAWIGCGHGPQPWHNFWTHREHVGGRFGGWLRTLSRPPEAAWMVGKVARLNFYQARAMARAHLMNAARWAGYTYPEMPSFLLNEPPHIDRSPRRVKRVDSDGSVRLFRSVREASTAFSWDRTLICRMIETGCLDAYNGFWCAL